MFSSAFLDWTDRLLKERVLLSLAMRKRSDPILEFPAYPFMTMQLRCNLPKRDPFSTITYYGARKDACTFCFIPYDVANYDRFLTFWATYLVFHLLAFLVIMSNFLILRWWVRAWHRWLHWPAGCPVITLGWSRSQWSQFLHSPVRRFRSFPCVWGAGRCR